jgi:putative phosphoesterase
MLNPPGTSVGIISDTHNQVERTQSAVELLQNEGADLLIHCGDFTSTEIVTICAVMPFYFVFGNNDYAADLEWAAEQTGAACLGWGGELTVGDKRIAVTHGHLTSDLRPLLESQPDYLLSGHSHMPDDSQAGVTRRINPGALFRARDYSVALLDVATDSLRFLEVAR